MGNKEKKGIGVAGYIAGGLAMIIVFGSLMFGLTWIGIEWRGFFGTKAAAVEREIFLETRSYNEAKIQDLAKYRLEYLRADSQEDKNAIASTVRMQFAEYNTDRLPNQELKDFMKEINQ